MLRTPWSRETIEALVAEAEACGHVAVEFDTLTMARNFRYACYNMRRRTGIGTAFSFVIEAATDNRTRVSIIKTPVLPKVVPIRVEGVSE